VTDTYRSRTARTILVITVFAIAAYMLVLSAIAPIMSDDLWYSLGMDRRGLQDISDVGRSCIELYNRYGARLGTMGFFLMSFFGRWLFIILNPIAFLALGLLTYILALGHSPSPDSVHDVGLLALVYLLIGGAAPAITEVSFWANGAMQYMWGCAAVFAFLVPFRYLLDGRIIIADTTEIAVVMLISGFIVGQATETIVPAAIGLVSALWIVSIRKGTQRPAWFYAGLAGLVVGFIVFVIAPGNFNRAATASSGTLWNMGLVDRFVNVVPHLFNKFAVYSGRFLFRILGSVAIVGLLVLVLDSFKTRRNKFAEIWKSRLPLALVCLATAVLMIFSLFIPPVKMSTRVYFGAGMMIILFLVIFVRVLFFEKYPKLAKYVVGVTCFLCFMEMAAIAKEYVGIHEQNRRRLEIVTCAKEAGLSRVKVPLFERQRRRHVWLADITENPNHPRNKTFAFYYGLEEVIGVEPDDTRDGGEH